MKSTFVISVLILCAATACNADKNDSVAITGDAQSTPAQESTVAEPSTEAVPPGDARPQAVEESGGQPDPSEADTQPIILAQAAAPASGRKWKFKEGKDYHRLIPTQPTLGGSDKIEVAEIFWYGCPHCFEFESFLNEWARTTPANVRFVRIAATWNPLVKLHAQLYYTEQVLVHDGKIKNPESFRAGVFTEYHRRHNRLASKPVIEKLFENSGISAEDFDAAWNSFEVAQKLRLAQDLARRYSITGVPTIVVNGKYRTGKTETGSYPKLLEVIDELIERESLR